MSNRAGYYRSNQMGEAEYKSFVPSPLPLMLQMDGELITELAKAHRMIGMLEGKLSQLPYAETFISMSICKEALMSSQIEGIRATFEDLLAPAKNDDDAEDAVNNVKAIKATIGHLGELPISSRLIRHAHRVLLSGSRGQSKEPGKYRHSQNWIGRAGSTLRTAIYVPPNVEDMNAAMSDLENYINDETDKTDALIKAGLIHYQFETIHPFLDGNGRIGRLLVVLYLMSRGVLSIPVLCISYAMKKHQMEYYEKMGEVSRSGDYEQWLKFFLRVVSESAENACITIDKLTALRGIVAENIKGLGRRAKRSMKLLAYLEGHPVLEVSQAARDVDLSANTISGAVKDLCNLGILESASGRRYSYQEYLDIWSDGESNGHVNYVWC